MSCIELKPGKKQWIEISARRGDLERSAWACAIGGAKDGPTLALLAGQHGMEPTGPAILSALAKDVEPEKLRGNLLIVPMVYAEALRCGDECEPIAGREKEHRRSGRWHNQCPYNLNRNKCGRNFNRLWPGNRRGSVYARLAAELWEHVVLPAQHVIDFHCWQDWSPPGVLTTDDAGLELAKWFGISWINHRPTHGPLDKVLLASNVVASGRVGVTVEFTPQTRVVADMAALGRQGIENVMRRLKMLPGKPKPTRPLYVLDHKPSGWKPAKAKSDVIVMPYVKPGDWVTRGQEVARVVEIDRPSKVSVLKAPITGIAQTTMASAAVRAGEHMMVFRRAKRLSPR